MITAYRIFIIMPCETRTHACMAYDTHGRMRMRAACATTPGPRALAARASATPRTSIVDAPAATPLPATHDVWPPATDNQGGSLVHRLSHRHSGTFLART